MRTYTLTNSLFDNFLTNWDRSFLDGDHSYWRRTNEISRKTLDDSYEFSMPLAGFRKSDIKASIKDEQVYILAKRDDDTSSYSLFVPDDADSSTLSAKHEDGMLTIKINKKEEKKSVDIAIS